MKPTKTKTLAFAFAAFTLMAGVTADGIAKTSRKSSSKTSSGSVKTIYTSPDGQEWIHQGNRGIYVTRDSLGIVRAQQSYSGKPSGKGYTDVVSEYARRLKDDNVRVYSLIAPTQGEFYLPEPVSTQGAEQACIEAIYSHLDPLVIPVMVNDTLRAHSDEKIYLYTDHHWAQLGAYYAAKVFAEKAGVGFRPLSEYTRHEVDGYVGSMYSFSGDPAVKNSPETFVYYTPPEGYEAEFITYKTSNGKTVGESGPEKRDFFRKVSNGSGSAYCVFMGGDTFTVKVSNTGGTPGRRVLIVKDSYGNALVPALFGSFEEVHVTDFRYFPHSLLDYVRKNGITDLVFVNTVQLAPAANTARRLETMMK